MTYLRDIYMTTLAPRGLARSSRFPHPAQDTRAILRRLLWLCATAADDCCLPLGQDIVKGQRTFVEILKRVPSHTAPHYHTSSKGWEQLNSYNESYIHSTGLHSVGMLITACLRGGLQISLQAQHLALPLTQLLSQGVQLGLMLGLQWSAWFRLLYGVCAC